MFSLPRMQLLSFAAAAGVLVIFGTPTMADELAQNLGPVGPHEPILTDVGSERVIAFYEPDNGRCAVQAVVFDKTDAYTGMTTAARVRVSLNPRETRSSRVPSTTRARSNCRRAANANITASPMLAPVGTTPSPCIGHLEGDKGEETFVADVITGQVGPVRSAQRG